MTARGRVLIRCSTAPDGPKSPLDGVRMEGRTRYAADTLSTSTPIPAQLTPYSVKGKLSLGHPSSSPDSKWVALTTSCSIWVLEWRWGAVEESRQLFPGQYQQASLLLPDTAAGRRLSNTKTSLELQELMSLLQNSGLGAWGVSIVRSRGGTIPGETTLCNPEREAPLLSPCHTWQILGSQAGEANQMPSSQHVPLVRSGNGTQRKWATTLR